MQYITTLNGKQFVVESGTALSPEQINNYAYNYAYQKMQGGGGGGGYPSCASAWVPGGMLKLGTATCGGPYVQNSLHTLIGTVISGGTAPFTYEWTITKPDKTTETKTGASVPYVFAQAGTYKKDLVVTDSCPVASGGPKSDTATCNVEITEVCVNPVCTINIA